MSKTTDKPKITDKEYIGVKLDPEIKERFIFLVKQEKLNLTDAIESLIVEALSRGYIIKERHEALTKEVNNG